MSKETRERIAFRMQPETRRRIEQWYAADNCQSKNEFIEKAVNFYVDYLGIQDNTTLLPMAITSAIDGRLRRMEDYIARSRTGMMMNGKTDPQEPLYQKHRRSRRIPSLHRNAGAGGAYPG